MTDDEIVDKIDEALDALAVVLMMGDGPEDLRRYVERASTALWNARLEVRQRRCTGTGGK